MGSLFPPFFLEAYGLRLPVHALGFCYHLIASAVFFVSLQSITWEQIRFYLILRCIKVVAVEIFVYVA